jgi:hypothetical protein
MADLQAQGNNVVTGARALFQLGGITIGWARNISISESLEYIPVEVLNNIEVAHHVPIAYRVSVSCSTIRILNSSFKQQGFVPKLGNTPTEHLANILRKDDLVMSLQDTYTGATLATITNIRVGDANISVDARGIMGYDVQLYAIRCLDESEVPAAA